MTWGTDKESRLKKQAIEALILWQREVETEARKLKIPSNVIHAIIVDTLIDCISLHASITSLTTADMADKLRSMIFDQVKRMRERSRTKYGINLEPQ